MKVAALDEIPTLFEIDAPAGTLISLPPERHRTAVAAEAETTVLAVGAIRGQAFTPSGWELRALNARRGGPAPVSRG